MMEWIIFYFVPLWWMLCVAYETKNGMFVVAGLIPFINILMVIGVILIAISWGSEYVINKIHERNKP